MFLETCLILRSLPKNKPAVLSLDLKNKYNTFITKLDIFSLIFVACRQQ